MKIYFSEEKLGKPLVEDMFPLTKKHHDETIGGDVAWDPDVAGYQQANTEERWVVFTMRASERHRLIGYAAYYVWDNLRYRGVKTASHDMAYVLPEYRGNGFRFFRFLEWCDDRLKEKGVKIIYQSYPIELNLKSRFKKMGYHAVDTVYKKVLT